MVTDRHLTDTHIDNDRTRAGGTRYHRKKDDMRERKRARRERRETTGDNVPYVHSRSRVGVAGARTRSGDGGTWAGDKDADADEGQGTRIARGAKRQEGEDGCGPNPTH